MLAARRIHPRPFAILILAFTISVEMIGAAAAGTVPGANACPGPSTHSTKSEAAAQQNNCEGGAAGRSIVVLSTNVSITLALGTFDSGLSPFPDIATGRAAFPVDRPLQLSGQLVDGNYTLLSYGGGAGAARRNQGVAGHGEEVRWWFDGAEQAPVPVSYRAPDNKDQSVINGTFFITNWVPDRSLVPSAGVHEMRFSFAGTRVFYPGLGEFQVYPPCDPPPLAVTVLFPTVTAVRAIEGTADAGGSATIQGSVRGSDGNISCDGAMVISDGTITLGPAQPKGLYVDDFEVGVPGIPAVVFHDGFENGGTGWSFGGDGGDWAVGIPAGSPSAYRGDACLGTGFAGAHSHLADEWAQSPSVDLSRYQADAAVSFALWTDLSAGDSALLSVWNGTEWSDPSLLSAPAREWNVLTVELSALMAGGHPLQFSGTTDLRSRFWLVGTTPSARVIGGAFVLGWDIPMDHPARSDFLTFRFVPAGPYTASIGYLKVDVRAKTAFDVPREGPLSASPGGWVEVKGRLLDGSGEPLALPLGREGESGLQAFWDDGLGNTTPVESVTGVNITGWFAAAHQIPIEVESGNASFILRFTGNGLYQPAEANVACRVGGQPRIEIEPAAAVYRNGTADVGGRVLLGQRAVAGLPVAVSVPFPPWSVPATTDGDGRFSVSFHVPADQSGVNVALVVTVAGGGAGLSDASATVQLRLGRRLSVVFDGSGLEKGRAVETVLDGLRFNGLAGRVVDDAGGGVGGAVVVVQALRPGGHQVLGRTQTGPDGYFDVPYTMDRSEPPGDLELQATASLPLSDSAERQANFEISALTVLKLDDLPPLVPGGWVDVTGTLTEDWKGAPGDPLRDAVVNVSFGDRVYAAVTDPGGRFRAHCAVDISSGNISVSARFDGSVELGAASDTSAAQIRGVGAPSGPPLRPAGGAPNTVGQAMAGTSFFAVLLGAALIGGTEAGRFKLLLALGPLYSKIRKEEVLDQFVRGQVFGYIQANPGDHYSSIRQTLHLKNGTLAYHLRTLERESFVFSRMDGIFRRFYPSGLDPSRVRLRSAVTETHRRIMELIDGNPGITPKELAERLGASHQVASYHVRLLARRGRIRLEQKGRNTLCYLPSAGAGGAGVK